MLSSFSSPLNSIPDIPGIISVVTAGITSVVGIISVVIGGHFGGGDHFDGGDHFGGGTEAKKNGNSLKLDRTLDLLPSPRNKFTPLTPFKSL